MIPWIEHPVLLEGTLVKLVPLDKSHFYELLRIGRNPEIWTHLPFDGTDTGSLMEELQSAMLKRMSGEQYPFVILERNTGKVIGSTRLFDIQPLHKKLEIGWTWNDPTYWGKGYNTESKLLLLGYCFEKLGAQRVQLKTRDTNLRSQAAIVKLGAKLEGILRKDRIAKDGSTRASFLYSIIDDEWPDIKKMLQDRLHFINTLHE
ncbi:GNAT family N-acetyltransferase [Chitinophagaceae bacterium MMS25-I14]